MAGSASDLNTAYRRTMSHCDVPPWAVTSFATCAWGERCRTVPSANIVCAQVVQLQMDCPTGWQQSCMPTMVVYFATQTWRFCWTNFCCHIETMHTETCPQYILYPLAVRNVTTFFNTCHYHRDTTGPIHYFRNPMHL